MKCHLVLEGVLQHSRSESLFVVVLGRDLTPISVLTRSVYGWNLQQGSRNREFATVYFYSQLAECQRPLTLHECECHCLPVARTGCRSLGQQLAAFVDRLRPSRLPARAACPQAAGNPLLRCQHCHVAGGPPLWRADCVFLEFSVNAHSH